LRLVEYMRCSRTSPPAIAPWHGPEENPDNPSMHLGAATMPRFRLTLRRLMAVIALAGLTSGMAIMVKRSLAFRARADQQADSEQMSRAYADDARGERGDPQRVARGEQMAMYHGQLRIKYERAARYPWLIPAPDPPIPGPPRDSGHGEAAVCLLRARHASTP
jgi:hypothetical protein